MKETDLFEPVKGYFLERGYEVFSEVLVYSWRADVVAKQGNIITVIELKTKMSLDLLEQASRWLYHAHYVYCCIPKPKHYHLNSYARKCLIRDGIGLLTVDFDGHYIDLDYDFEEDFNKPFVREEFSPKLNRKICTNWSLFLTEEHKITLPGGSKGGGYITPYKRTMEEVRRILKSYPTGISLDDLVEKCINNHYANKKWGLYQALTKYETAWCESFKMNGKTFFRLKN